MRKSDVNILSLDFFQQSIFSFVLFEEFILKYFKNKKLRYKKFIKQNNNKYIYCQI
jgi:hypothetical protein